MSTSERFAGLFGAPEDDPLLQDAPPSQEDTGSPDDAPGRSSPTASTAASTSTAAPPQGDATDAARDDRVLLISQSDAADGRLAPLRAALRRGWVLDNIRVDDAPSNASAPPIAFRLARAER